MALVLALVGQKGGTGKTTAAVNVAAELAARGRRVLLVDADPQGTARTWGAVAAEAGRPAPAVVAMGSTMHRPGQLDAAAAAFDLVVLDCPPRAGDVARSALMVADLAVLPCGASPADAWALAATVDLVGEARALRPELRAAVLLTRVQRRTALAAGARSVLGAAGLPVLRSALGWRVAFQEALAAGAGVTTYAPRGPAAAEVRALVDELLEVAHGKEASPDHRSPPAARTGRGGVRSRRRGA